MTASKLAGRFLATALAASLALIIPGGTFAQTPDIADYRAQAERERADAQVARQHAREWHDLADKARVRLKGASGAMKDILDSQIAQDEQEAADASAKADQLEKQALELDRKAQEATASRAASPIASPSTQTSSNAGAPEGAPNPLQPPTMPAESGKGSPPPPQQSACGCKPLDSWPKDKAPKAGSVYEEISNSYLENQFSNRADRYDGDWRKSLQALAHDIDPDGKLNVSTGPAPAPAHPEIPVREGLISDVFVKGFPEGKERPNIDSGETIASVLTHTLARIRRYGETSSGLREHCLLLGHFIADDLSRIPETDYTVRHDRRAMFLLGFANGFRATISNIAEIASPRQHQVWDGHKPKEFSYPNEPMALDEYDLADAALDIISFHDDKTNQDVTWSTPDNEAPPRTMRDLLLTASGKSEFLPPGTVVDPRQASVACKAYDTLLACARPDRKLSEKSRAQILAVLQGTMYKESDVVPNLNPLLLASRSVLASDGPGSADEARSLAESLFSFARFQYESCGGGAVWHLTEGDALIDLLTALSQPGPNNPYASVVAEGIKNHADEIEKRLKELQEQKPPGDDKCARQLLARLIAPSSLVAARAGQPCAPPQCNFTIDSMAPENLDLKLEGRASIAVLPKRYFPWPAQSLDGYQPFFVEVTLNYDDAQKQGATLPVTFEVAGTGRSKTVNLSGAPHHGPTVYSTDAPIVFQREFSVKGPSDLVSSPWDSVDLESLKLKNGDVVKVSNGDASTSFRYYDSWVQQRIAQNEEGFIDLRAAYEQRLVTFSDNAPEMQKRIRMIDNARKIINDYHPAVSDDQLTDLDRCFIGNEYHRLLDDGPPGPDDRDEQRRKNWTSGPSDSKRFGIQFVNDAEANAVASGILERKNYLKEGLAKIPIGFALAEYHILTQLSGANQMWTAVFGIDEDGNPVDLTGRLFAAGGAASGALFSVAVSRYLTDLSPSAKARARASTVDEMVDEPNDLDYQINPENSKTVQENIEGKTYGDVSTKPDLDLAREAYGPNVSFREPDPSRPAVLQIGNRNCLFSVTRSHILAGTGRKVPEMALRTAAAIEGWTRPGQGSSRGGYVFLINRLGGKGSKVDAGLKGLKQLLDADYYVLAVVKAKTGGNHAVDFRGYIKGATTDYAVFSDPYFGKDVMLPVCDFRDIFITNTTTGRGQAAIADFGQAKALK